MVFRCFAQLTQLSEISRNIDMISRSYMQSKTGETEWSFKDIYLFY